MDLLSWFLNAFDFWRFSFWEPVIALSMFSLISGLLLRLTNR